MQRAECRAVEGVTRIAPPLLRVMTAAGREVYRHELLLTTAFAVGLTHRPNWYAHVALISLENVW
jgi:hypothetical protein